MTNRSCSYMRRRILRRNTRHNNSNQSRNDDNVIHNEKTIFDTATTIPRPITKNTNTVVFDFHNMNVILPVILILLEDQFGENEVVTVNNLQASNYCQPNCEVIEVLFASESSTQLAIRKGLKIENNYIRAAPVVKTIHYQEIFKFLKQQNDGKEKEKFDEDADTMIAWSKKVSETDTKCTVFTLFNIPMNDITSTIQDIKRSIIYMENWFKLTKEYPSMITYETTSQQGYLGPLSMSPSLDDHDNENDNFSPLITVFPVQYPGTHLKKNAYYVVIHGHQLIYSIFKSSSSPLSHANHTLPGRGTARLICFGNHSFTYDRVSFDRAFCFRCKESDSHFTEACPMNDLVDNFRSLCIHQLASSS
ncbi:unnamed protein product [Cunninghamella echinulata]